MQQQNSLGPVQGSKGQISLHYNNLVNFNDFFYQTLCVFIQIKDMKDIERDFCSDAYVMPQGWDLGWLGCQGGKKNRILFMWHIKLTGIMI